MTLLLATNFTALLLLKNVCVCVSEWVCVEDWWYRQGNTEVLGQKPDLLPASPQIMPRGLTLNRTRDSSVRGQRLNIWYIAWP